MADLGGVFVQSSVSPLGDRTPLPAGPYRAVARKSEWKNTKSGGNKFLEIVWKVVDGEHNGRMLWSRLNLQNSNSQAVEIARAELSSICLAAGIAKLRDSVELHDIPLVLMVAVKKREDTGDPTNEITGYKSVKEFAAKQESTATAATGDKPNWM